MATPLRMPDLGTVEGDVTLVRWLKKEGDTIVLGEPLFEVETDKGVSEIEAAMAGVLVKRLVPDGAKAGSGEPIALIRRPGEPEEPSRSAAPPADVPSAPPAPVTGTARTGRAVAPVIRALAERYGVDLGAVNATGPAGMITREDVLRARAGGAPGGAAPSPRPAVPSASPTTGASASGGLSHAQGIVARKVGQSHREKPVYHVSSRVDMSRAIALREKAKQSGTSISWDAIVVKAVATAIAEMPVFRRWLNGEEVAEHASVDVAVATAVGDDLSIPAVRAADSKGVPAISREIATSAAKAASRALAAQDIEDSCFLVSNLGMFPVDSFDAIIYPEHSAALAVGTITPTPVSDGKNTWIAPLAHLTLSADHRLIYGAVAARFLARVKDVLENGDLS